MPGTWLQRMFPSEDARKNHCEKHLIGDVPDSMAEFETFFIQRKARLRKQVGRLLQRGLGDREPGLDGLNLGGGTE